MNFVVNSFLSLSISLGAIIGWVRFRRTSPAYWPFLWLMWTGFYYELLGIVVMLAGYYNVVGYNIYALVESLLLGLQFWRWGLFGKLRSLYWALQALFTVGWVVDNFIVAPINVFSSYFTIGRSIIIVLLSVGMLRLLFEKPVASLLRHPVFLICIGLVVLFTFTAIVEGFLIFGAGMSRQFRVRIFFILACINFITNIIFAFAILWMPIKRRYSLQY
jgi:hypothetical protein